MNRGQSVQQVKSLDRSARTMGVAVLMREDQRRPSGTIHNARGQYPENPAMPGWIVQNDAVGHKRSVGVAQSLPLNLDGRKRSPRFPVAWAPIGIEKSLSRHPKRRSPLRCILLSPALAWAGSLELRARYEPNGGSQAIEFEEIANRGKTSAENIKI